MPQRLIALAALVLGLLAYGAYKAVNDSAGIVKPDVLDYGGNPLSVTPVHRVVHEYIDDTYKTTGRSLVFMIPEGYMLSGPNRPDARFTLRMTFDRETDEPAEAWGIHERKARGINTLRPDTEEEIRVVTRFQDDALRRRVSLGLTIRKLHDLSGPLRSWTRQDLIDGKPLEFLSYRGKPELASEAYCGFQPIFAESYRVIQQPQHPPFDSATHFAWKNADGTYGPVIVCEAGSFVEADSAYYRHPICRVNERFEDDWKLTIVFSGAELCHYQDVVKQTRDMLTRFLVERTPRRAR